MRDWSEHSRFAAAALVALLLTACGLAEPRAGTAAGAQMPFPQVAAAAVSSATSSPLGIAPATASAPAAVASGAAATLSAPAADDSPRLPAAPSAPATLVESRNAATADAALDLLAFHERVREMSAAELAREASRLGDLPSGPRVALALAIVLAQTHGPGDLLRALALVEPIARSTHPAAAPWQPFARWLALRYAEQRRLEEQVERLTQQLREQQRRIDQLNEKLTALRAIERSLGRSNSAPGSSSGMAPRPSNPPVAR